MVRSLWTAASGMIAQQTNVDNIANNLANVNTTGYKKVSTEFQTLLYSKLQTDTTDANGDPKPVIGQVGSGVRVSGLVSQFTQGATNQTEGTYDFAIDGDGFFMVSMENGEVGYTRNGAFGLSIGTEGLTLSNSQGYAVLDTNGQPIVYQSEWGDYTKVYADETGTLYYTAVTEETNLAGDTVSVETVTSTGVQIGLAQFNNPAGLEKRAGSIYVATENSGEPRIEGTDTALSKSKILQGYLEASNVATVDEVVNLIVAQRAYEMNSKAIQASDEMLQQANNLRQ